MTQKHAEYNLPAADDNLAEPGNHPGEKREGFPETVREKEKRAELSYLNDEELDRLIAQTEQSGMLAAPSFLKREVFQEIRRRKNISQMNAARLKTWQIVTVVAAAILFLTVMPLEQQVSGQNAPGILGSIRQESVLLNREPAAQENAAKEENRQDLVGDWMYEKNLQVGSAVRQITDQLVPKFMKK